MAGYSARQSSFTTGDTILAAHSNDEFNQVLAAFHATTGHSHDGTAGEGGPVTTLRDADALNKILVDTTNNHLEFYVEVSSAAVQQLRIQDGAIVPITDNDIDLGTSSLEFKDLYVDGTAYVDAINFNGTAITSTAAELNILDGVTSTATELNIMDGDTSASSTTVVDADRVVLNDDGTMKQVAVTDLAAYFDDEITAMPNLTSVGTLTTLTVDDITINGSTVSDSGDFTIDGGADIILDADGGDIFFKDGGTTFGSATNTSGNLIIKSGTTTALTFSGANVTIAGDLTVSGDDITMGTNTDTAIMVADGTNFNPVVPSGDVTLTNAGVFGIASGVIVNADINASAAIADSKLATISTADKVSGAAVQIDGATDGTSITIADSDKFLIDDGGTTKYVNASQINAYTSAAVAADDISTGDAAVNLATSAGDITIDAQGNDTDIIFKGTDGGVDTTFLTIDGSDAGKATFTGAVAIGGDLTVNGTTTTVNSTTVTIDDPIFTLGGDTAPASDDNKDRGIEFRYHNGSAAKVGFFGFDDSAGKFTFIADASNSSEVFSGSAGDVAFGEVVATSLDISGDIDVDGTTNLDVVDIDGAVDMASTLQVDGAITSSSDLTVNTDTLFVDASADKVGIGTTTLTTGANLTLSGQGFLTSGADSGSIAFGSNASFQGRIYQDNNGSDFYIENTYANNNGDIIIKTNGSERLRVKGSGEIGINASSPSTTLDVAGNATITTADNSDTLTLKSTDADADAGPILALTRDSGSPADDDIIGRVVFKADDDAGNVTNLFTVDTRIADASNGTEDFKTVFAGMVAGTERHVFTLGSTEAVFNDGSQDIDFRVEGNGNANMLFVDAGNDRVGIGTNSPDSQLHVEASSGSATLRLEASSSEKGDLQANSGNITLRTIGSYPLILNTNQTERMRILSGGNVGIGTSSPAHNLEIVATNGGSINDTLQIRNNATSSGTGSRIRFINSTDENSDTNGAAIASVRNGDDNDLVFEAENSEAMRIDHAGNVGIGTTSPGETLDVDGTIRADSGYLPLQTLTDGATINWNMDTQQVCRVTLGGNRTMAAPTNANSGQIALIEVKQDGTGSRTLTWNAIYEFKDDTAPTLTTTANKADLFVFYYNGSKWQEVGRNQNLTTS